MPVYRDGVAQDEGKGNLYLDGSLLQTDAYRDGLSVDPSMVLFDVPSSVSGLPAALTINGITESPLFRIFGEDVVPDVSWPLRDGGPATFVVNNTGVDHDVDTPLLDDTNRGVIPNGRHWNAGAFLNITSEDIVGEALVRSPTDGSNRTVFGVRDSVDGNRGFAFMTTNRPSIIMNDGTYSQFQGDPVISPSRWYHLIYFVDRSGSVGYYVNGVAAGTSVVSARSNDLDEGDNITTIGSWGVGANTYNEGCIVYAAMWARDAWLDTHAQDDVARERFSIVTGLYPSLALGDTKAPVSLGRASEASLDKLDGGVRRIYNVGDNWVRTVRVKDDDGDDFFGLLIEPESENVILQSEDISTSWTKNTGTETIATDAIEAPDGSITADGIIAPAVNSPYGVAQVPVPYLPIGTNWCVSLFAKAGNRNWIRLDNGGGGDSVYFDIVNGVVGTTGGDFVAAGAIPYVNDWWRCWWTMIGPGNHTLRILTAEADGDIFHTGDGATVNTYVWGIQAEAGEFPSSYIKTTTVAVTRPADSLRYKTDDGSIADLQEGTCEYECLLPDYADGYDKYAFALSDGGAASDVVSGLVTDAGKHRALSAASAGSPGDAHDATGQDVSDGLPHAMRVSWKQNDLRVTTDGSYTDAGSVDASVDVPTGLSRLDVGSDVALASQFRGLIRNMRFYRKHL